MERVISLCVLQCHIDPVLDVLVNVDFGHCLINRIGLCFEGLDVAKLYNFFLAFTDGVEPDEYFYEIHARNDDYLDHLPSLEDGEGSVDIIQPI